MINFCEPLISRDLYTNASISCNKEVFQHLIFLRTVHDISHYTTQASLSLISVEQVLHFSLGLWIKSGVDQFSKSIPAVLFFGFLSLF